MHRCARLANRCRYGDYLHAMKSPLLILVLATVIIAAETAPQLMEVHIAKAKVFLNSKHALVELWPDFFQFDKILRSPKPIDTKEDFRNLLSTAPSGWNHSSSFGDIVEFDGWFAVELFITDSGRSDRSYVGNMGLLVKKGSKELCPYIAW